MHAHAVRCDDINSSVLIINGSLSQIPESRLELTCIYDLLSFAVIERQEDGSWQPDPANLMCDCGTQMSSAHVCNEV